jgi:hypothetical protein
MSEDKEEQRLIAQWNRRDRIATGIAKAIGCTIVVVLALGLFVALVNSVESCNACLDRGGRPVQGLMGQWECVP